MGLLKQIKNHFGKRRRLNQLILIKSREQPWQPADAIAWDNFLNSEPGKRLLIMLDDAIIEDVRNQENPDLLRGEARVLEWLSNMRQNSGIDHGDDSELSTIQQFERYSGA